MGALTLFDDVTKAEYLRLRLEGKTNTAACRELKITTRAVTHAKVADERFADELEMIEQGAVEDVEAAMFEAARNGSVVAGKFILTSRAREVYGKRIEIEHTTGQERRTSPIELVQATVEVIRSLITDPNADTRSQVMSFVDLELPPPGGEPIDAELVEST